MSTKFAWKQKYPKYGGWSGDFVAIVFGWVLVLLAATVIGWAVMWLQGGM